MYRQKNHGNGYRRHAHDHGHEGGRGTHPFAGRGGQGRGGHSRGGLGRGGGRMGRMFDHGDLRYIVLHLISEKPRHGYEIIKAIEDELGGAYSPSPGVIYPTLTLLDEMGHAEVASVSGTKKLYAITDEGRNFLSANKPTVEAVLARVKIARERHGGGPAPSILRAMENLKMALRLRTERGPLSDDDIQAIAAAIDAAAVAVDRS